MIGDSSRIKIIKKILQGFRNKKVDELATIELIDSIVYGSSRLNKEEKEIIALVCK